MELLRAKLVKITISPTMSLLVYPTNMDGPLIEIDNLSANRWYSFMVTGRNSVEAN